MDIPYRTLKPETLEKLIENFVMREGTDYGHIDHGIDAKVKQVLKQLEDGKAKICFDPDTESCDIVPNY